MDTRTTINKQKQSPNWNVAKDSFTGDELIEAYFKGCSEGVDQFKRVLLKKLNENLMMAQSLGSKFISNLNNDNIICTSAHLKYLDIERYKIIFVINRDFYFDFEKMTPIYEMAEIFETTNSKDDFYIEVSFVPGIKTLNNHRLISDGFIFHYNGK